MTALIGDLEANDGLMSVTPPLTNVSLPVPVAIESENLLITGGDGTAANPYSITRGQNGTLGAAHTAGTTVTTGWSGGGGGSISATGGDVTVPNVTEIQFPPGTVTDAGGGVAAVGLILSMIGPFPFAFDDTRNVLDAYISLAEVPAGCAVVRAWVTFDPWFDDPNPYAFLYLYTEAGGTTRAIAEYAPPAGGGVALDQASWESELYVFNAAFETQPTSTHVVVLGATPATLVVDCPSGGTHGAGKAYLLIATPAS